MNKTKILDEGKRFILELEQKGFTGEEALACFEGAPGK